MSRQNTRIVKEYLHGDNDELSDLWDHDARQQEKYHYALYEVGIDLEVDMDTGESRIVAVDGIKLTRPGMWH